MKKAVLLMIAVCMLFSFAACRPAATDGADLTVAVGIVPEAAFVEKVAGDLVEVVTLVPPGNSPANYQPTTTEMRALSDASIYFTLQMPTEEANILPKVSDFNKDIMIVNLRDAVSEVYPMRHMAAHSHDEEGEEHEEDEHEHEDGEETVDPHLWLSPKRAMVMVQTIADELSAIDADHTEIYQQNAAHYIAELEALDSDIEEAVSALDNNAFLIYHPAYGYFADDYDLTMIAIEIAGKQATAAELQEVIEYARRYGITTVYYQEEFDDSQAQTVAEEIGGNAAKVAPLTPDYVQGLRDFATALTGE